MKFLIGVRARYVLVDAADEADARSKGEDALRELYSHIWRKGVPIGVTTVRPATDDEVERWRSREAEHAAG
jgi:hypothetical protein